MKRARILVVDRDPREGAAMRAALGARGFEVREVATGAGALAMLPSYQPDVVLTDVQLPDCDSVRLAAGILESGSDAALVVASESDELDIAVAAMRSGAESFVVKPLDPGQVAVVLEKALETRQLLRDSADLRARLRERYSIVGAAPELQSVHDVIRRAAPTKATVLVQGETGTGKELVAHALHQASPRRDRPFVKVNCSALSETLLESELFGYEKGSFAEANERRDGRLLLADGGTIFLHEVGQLAPSLQVKLLRVLQQGEFERVGGRETLRVDVRVVAATNRDLAEEIRAGRFRDDLYYRLNVVTLTLTPLRQRKGDIPALVNRLIELHSRAQGKAIAGVTPGTLSALFAYDWPGNIRELENVIERAISVASGSEITAEDLPPVLHGARPEERAASALIPGATLFEIEREAILRTLEVVNGSTARAAEMLGISVRKIQYRLKEYRTGRLVRRRRSTVPVRELAVGGERRS